MMTKINCLAIDDEPLALDVIEDLASKVPFLNLKGRVQSALEAMSFLEKEAIDLIFLDIQMNDLTGFELLRTLEKKPLVIFTTAYPNYALESYEVDAVDYLMKPIPLDRFVRAVNKAKQRLASKKPATDQPVVVKENTPSFIFVKSEYRSVKINLDDILYVESLKDYVAFQLKEERILSLLSMKEVEESLPSERFIRIHRSFIVSMDKIETIERNQVVLGEKRVTVGESYREEFKKLLTAYQV